ncbi:tetratricopeptide repeat protein [Streptomyces sp. LP05-1]|uniref:Tetratricopeptide repeat protein n=1 Tax=Streptomyces pyxinae TaxID=2970734 RepID=A0ABT2CG60_9ACTN|nr:BTAD domain-containing putative transcriptional regulator [Streptomyces sp. LP05-1]MCS0635686.1 tetratricopeptide repeat protein [Streptomyces sp. LP05-1]
MEVRLLGPVELWHGERRIPLNGPKPAALLAALVIHPGEVLSVDRLVDMVWEERPPATARALVASHVSGLRRALATTGEDGAIRTRSPGYLAEFPAARVDARRFEAALAEGRLLADAGRAAEAVDTLRAAVRLWRGRDALEGLGQSFARVEAVRLAELRLVAQEVRFAAELALGCRAELVAELLAHVAANPLRERPRGQLMIALHRTGRVPDALRVYQEGSRLLRTELGIDPGRELRALHQAVLRGDSGVLGPPALPGDPAPLSGGLRPGRPPGTRPDAPGAGPPAAPGAGLPEVRSGPSGHGAPEARSGPPALPESRSGPPAPALPGPRSGSPAPVLPGPRSGPPARPAAAVPGMEAVPGAAPGPPEAGPPEAGPASAPAPAGPGNADGARSTTGPGAPGSPAGAAVLPQRPVRRPVTAEHPVPPPPFQLPPDMADFVGRAEQLAWAAGLFAAAGGDPPRTAPLIGVISGRSGIGKTALAVHAAHRVAAHFPDGQLFLDLRAAGSEPVDTADALLRLLRALGADPGTLHRHRHDPAELVDLYRGHIVHRRILLVLDNAVGETPLRPLLPPGGGSGVLITSRRRLVALEGAAHLDLTAPPEPEALELLARVAGADRAAAEPDPVAEILALCGRLPLAVRIAGARLAARPHWSPTRLAARLRDEHRRLDELQVGDLEVRGSLGLAYADLTGPERRTLRRLALLDLPDFAAWIAAPLLDLGPDEAEEVVEQLVDCHFVDVVGVDGTGRTRYRIHDLAREHARERALAEEPAVERAAAVRRLVDCWLALSRVAAARAPGGAARLFPGPDPAGPLAPGLAAVPAADPAAWFAAEHPSLLVAVKHCAALGLADRARELAAALMAGSVALYNQFDTWSHSHTVALDAVRRCGDVEGEALLLGGLGQLRLEQDRFEDAYAFFQDALRLFGETGSVRGRAVALAGLGTTRREQGRFDEALALLTAALTAYRVLDDRAGQAHVRYGIGCTHRERGRFTEAGDELSAARHLYGTAGDRHGEALVLRALGLCHRALGELAEAEELLTAALEIFERTGDTFGMMYAGQSLAKVRLRQGRLPEARARLDRCLATTRERQDRFGEALVLRTLGEWWLAAGEWRAAEEPLRSALALWDELRLPLWRARTLRDLATGAAGRGDPRAARVLRDEALGIFRALGAREAGELDEAGEPDGAAEPDGTSEAGGAGRPARSGEPGGAEEPGGAGQPC